MNTRDLSVIQEAIALGEVWSKLRDLISQPGAASQLRPALHVALVQAMALDEGREIDRDAFIGALLHLQAPTAHMGIDLWRYGQLARLHNIQCPWANALDPAQPLDPLLLRFLESDPFNQDRDGKRHILMSIAETAVRSAPKTSWIFQDSAAWGRLKLAYRATRQLRPKGTSWMIASALPRPGQCRDHRAALRLLTKRMTEIVDQRLAQTHAHARSQQDIDHLAGNMRSADKLKTILSLAARHVGINTAMVCDELGLSPAQSGRHLTALSSAGLLTPLGDRSRFQVWASPSLPWGQRHQNNTTKPPKPSNERRHDSGTALAELEAALSETAWLAGAKGSGGRPSGDG